jgi:uncharacterized protein
MKVLALQGGGCLGYGQVLVLAELERRAGAPAGELFDLIGGTSVGSIIGAALATGIPAARIAEFFTQDAPEIFQSNLLNDAEALLRPKYAAEPLERGLQDLLHEATLADCQTKFIATSYDFASDRPVYFISYEQTRCTKDFIVIGKDSPMPLWQICRCSAAAQTYFPGYECLLPDGSSGLLLDGGNAGDNAPDALLAIEAIRFAGAELIKMLSLGSGDSAWTANPDSMVNPSKARAGLETIAILFSAGESAEVFKASRVPNVIHFRLSPDLGNGIAIDDAAACLTRIPPAVAALLADKSAMLDEFVPVDGK